MNLTDYLNPQLVSLHLPGNTKSDVLGALASLLSDAGVIADREALVSSLEEREGLGSTGIGHGVAIPHGRSRELSKAAVAFGRAKEDVDFAAIDGAGTRLFFLVVAPEDGTNEHLHLLAKIARITRNATTRELLLTLETPEEVLALIKDSEPH